MSDLARQLGTTDRTLRRLAQVGTIRAGRRRQGARAAVMQEEAYLRDHWELLDALRSALRTEPRVVMALIFGSTATGHDTPSSDIDLVVALDREMTLRELHQLRVRLTRKIGKSVDLFNLDDLIAQPELLAPVLDEARPVVDRASVWPLLRATRGRRPRVDLDRRRRWALTARH